MIAQASPVVLTIPGMPDEVVAGRSQAGVNASNLRWHEVECRRRARKGDLVFIRRNGGGRIHLALGAARPQDDVVYAAKTEGGMR